MTAYDVSDTKPSRRGARTQPWMPAY